MGGCCSRQEELEGFPWGHEELSEEEGNKSGVRCVSMHTKQGWKGANQDAMVICQDFAGHKDQIFCGVFDGHGPSGGKVARHVRDALPVKLCSLQTLKDSEDQASSANSVSSGEFRDTDGAMQLLSSWNNIFVKSFEDLDEELRQHPVIDCICSGTTAVAVVRQGDHLIIANLGDSRAVLCTRDGNCKNRRIPVQLTTDLKPNLPSETERILRCKGRVFALEDEPEVPRLWLPDQAAPGLAMARALGDFCLKNHGLICTPQVSYRKLSEKDEFVVLATDGVWDVLSNKEVVKIVSSINDQSKAAKALVDRAVRAWRRKYPTSMVDDCAAVCLFLRPISAGEAPRGNAESRAMSMLVKSSSTARSEEGMAWAALDGVSRANSMARLPRLGTVLSWRKRSTSVDQDRD